jgi:acyl-lipid omega-6 desaturase (Delta-12 desaturase)
MRIESDIDGHDYKKLREILSNYQNPSLHHSLWQLANTLIPYALLWYLMFLSLRISYWLTLALAILAAGFMMRTFIIFHDCGHGSFFKSRRANRLVGMITGILTFTPFDHWRHDHAIHHATAGNLDRRGVGDVQTLTVEEFQAMPRSRRWIYQFTRHPLVMFTFGSFLVFTVFHRFYRPGAGRRERMSVHITNLALVGLVGSLMALMGWKAYLLIQIPVMLFATSAGVWLFYVQHNFAGTYWERQNRWSFIQAGLKGSSFYQLPVILQWFSGNIGFHHIHHLNSLIPNYFLPRCHRENPIFQVQPMSLRMSLRSLGLRLWDEQNREMVGFAGLQGRIPTREV